MVKLEAHGVTLAIGSRVLCTNLNLELKSGEQWIVLGPNGSGKTTLLHTLAGLRPPTAGEIHLNGRDIRAFNARARAREIAILFQDYDVALPSTVVETVMTGRYPHGRRWQWHDGDAHAQARAALGRMGLADFSERPLATLSGGERRRVEVAALVAQQTPICLLDEPTQHLDLRYQIEVLATLATHATLIVAVLHDINLAARRGTHGVLLFGDGTYVCGLLTKLLVRTTLERLYQVPLREITTTDGHYFLPA